jgi:hypothetical protein
LVQQGPCQQEGHSFLKKNQKTVGPLLARCRAVAGWIGDSAGESFLILFFKKEGLPPPTRTLRSQTLRSDT